MIRRRSAAAALLAASVIALGPAGAAPLPYTLAVDIAYGDPRGPSSFVDELELELLSRLERAGCFEQVVAGSPAGGVEDTLVLRVRLDRFEEQIEYEMSLAQRAQNRSPQEAARQRVARVETLVRVEMLIDEPPTSVRSRRFASRSSWRPVLLEDPAEEARIRLVDDVARSIREYACRGSAAKWSSWIRKARRRAGAD